MSLLKNIKKFEFIVLSCFWYKQLSRIDIVNKLLQRKDITIDRTSKHINNLISEFQEERGTCSTMAISEAKEIATKLSVDPNFKEVRKRKKKRMFDEKGEDEIHEFSEERKFGDLIVQIIDQVLSELERRFKVIQEVNALFGFLNGPAFRSLSGDVLKNRASDLAAKYKEDLNGEELIVEVESFKYHALDLGPNMKTDTSYDLLQSMYKNGLEEAYPNITTALTIFLTLPVSVATNERSFSKLKIIKNYIRNLSGQQRLSNLGIISIEYKTASNLCLKDIVNIFAAKKARKVHF